MSAFLIAATSATEHVASQVASFRGAGMGDSGWNINGFKDLAPVLTASVLAYRIIWSLLIRIYYIVVEHISVPAKTSFIDLGPYRDIPEHAKLKCLVVRYGTDPYIRHMAPNQDKYEGRLRNKILPVDVNRTGDGRLYVHLRIPVHSRLGTQFKMFFELSDRETAERMKQMNSFSEGDIVEHMKSVKLWFLSDRFPTTKTVEEYTNNFWPAI